MTFDDWYLKEIGVTVAGAEARNVRDLTIMRKCWTDSVAAERARCAAILKARADKITDVSERAVKSEPDDVSALLAMAWQLTVAEREICGD